MGKTKVAVALSILAAASLAFAQEPAKPAAQASPKTEQPASAAGGQSAGASPGTAAAGGSLHVETIAMILGAIGAAVVTAAVANDSTTQH